LVTIISHVCVYFSVIADLIITFEKMNNLG
jgi:hypothetical protein